MAPVVHSAATAVPVGARLRGPARTLAHDPQAACCRACSPVSHVPVPALRPRARHWLAACLCAWLCAGALPPAWGQGTADGADGRSATPAPAFELQVRAPGRIRDLLQRHLDIRRFRDVPDLDEVELARLVRLAESDARELLGTLGLFAPVLAIRQQPGQGDAPPAIVVEVEPGPQTIVDGLELGFAGHVSGDDGREAQSLRQRIREGWTLPPGRPWTQDAWDDAKAAALRDLAARRYPAARLDDSVAQVDAAAGTARLGLRLDSGPLFRLGEMQVTGTQRYDPVLVPRLARLAPGSLYDRDAIQRAQLRLTGSGYYDSAFLYVDPEGPSDPAPVQATVREAPLQRVVLGVGASTDAGPRLSADYIHNRVPGLGWRAVNRLQLDRRAPFLQSELTGLPDATLWRWAVSGRVERLDDGALVTTGQRLRLGRQKSDDRFDRNAYLQYDRAQVRPRAGAALPQDTGDGSALTANYVWAGRWYDRVPYPSRGYALGLEVAAGVTLEGSRSPFQRTVLRGTRIQPLPEGRLQLRGELGGVFAKSEARVPATQLFRTGGDTSVRGYGLRDIGVLRDGVVAPGRYLAVGSIEWQRPIRRAGVPTAFEHVLFTDAGAVADEFRQLRPSWGVGTGVRWRSPLGPLQADLAYGLDSKRLRLHLTLAATF